VRLIIENHYALDQVEAALATFMSLSDDVSWDQVADADIGFHRAVLAAAGSPRLLRTFNDVGAELRLFIAQLRPAYRGAHEIAAEHEVLLKALQAGKIRPAVEAWREHLDDAQAFFLDLIKERAL
jgi:DNA-binding GntR family transcriptional regulator